MDCKNQYPCAECAVFDNNGNDLKTFVYNSKRTVSERGSKVLDYSNDNWGYLMVKTGNVPSVSTKWPRQGDLNYSQFIRATYVLNQTSAGSKATWWARECSLPNGPLVDIRVNGGDKVEMPTERYPKVMRDLDNKKFTLVEYSDSNYNARDYDYLLKNHILLPLGAVTNYDDYKAIIDVHNGFLTKFGSVSDPVLSTKSFITFVKGPSKNYIGYFNQVNGKLSGRLEVADLQYEKDKDDLVGKVFRRLNGKTVFVYGDETFGMDKNIIKYARANSIKLKRRLSNATKRFNEE